MYFWWSLARATCRPCSKFLRSLPSLHCSSASVSSSLRFRAPSLFGFLCASAYNSTSLPLVASSFNLNSPSKWVDIPLWMQAPWKYFPFVWGGHFALPWIKPESSSCCSHFWNSSSLIIKRLFFFCYTFLASSLIIKRFFLLPDYCFLFLNF